MRILFLTHRIPFPPHKGEKIRSFNILKFLAAHHEVYLASLLDTASDLQFVPEIERRVREFLFDRIDGRLKSVYAVHSIVRSRSITVDYFYSLALQRKIDGLIERAGIDVFFCSSSPMAEYLFKSSHIGGRIASAIRVMDLIDVDSHKWRQYAERSPPWSAWIYRHEALHLARYEERIARAFDRVLVVSPQEMAHFPSKGPVGNLESMANGVDLKWFAPRPGDSVLHQGPTLVFTGVMDYWPNVEGVSWFVGHVYPLIESRIPDVRLFIVGSRPIKAVRRLGSRRGVTVTGFVEDVRDYVGRASVCVAPLRIACGVQNKVLEAMAMGRPVVSTPQALAGIEARPAEDIVIAHEEQSFAQEVVRLLQNRDEAERIGRNARRCVEQRYSWDRNLCLLDEIWGREPCKSLP